MSTRRRPAVKLPGQSPCTFDGADGWKICLEHGWSGPESQRARVLVCPDVAEFKTYPDQMIARLRAIAWAARTYLAHDGSGIGRDDEWRGDFDAFLLHDAREQLRAFLSPIVEERKL